MDKRPVTNRSLRAIKTKSKLFKSAVKLIDKYGYDNVTIEDISRQAGVSVGAFYHYYNSKTDIVVEFFKQIDLYFEEKAEDIASRESAAESLTEFFRHYAKFHVVRGFDHTRMILKVQSGFFNDRSRYMYGLLGEIVRRGRETGVFSATHTADAVIDYFLVIARGLLFDWVLEKGHYDLVEKMDACIRRAMLAFRQEA